MIDIKEQSKEINVLLNAEKWQEARALIHQLLVYEPDDHFLLSVLSNTYYEQRDYSMALEYVEQAVKQNPDCWLVLWDYAGTLDMLGRKNEAVKVYRKLIDKGPQRIAYEECGEGLSHAKRLVNDCRYRIALCYFDMNDFRLASKYLKEHIRNRELGVRSGYNLRQARKKYALSVQGKDPRRSWP